MTKTAATLAALIAAFIVANTIAYHYSPNNGTQATPTHQTAIFVDALNHGDYRQACTTIAPAVIRHAFHGITGCEEYFTINNAQAIFSSGNIGGYSVVPHSYKGWRQGKHEMASVKVLYAPTGKLRYTVHLVKTRHGWRLTGLGA